jgi:exodeoxyribonuclease V gamma subunit
MPQTNLKIFTSNRLEILAKQLSRVVRSPQSTLLAPEIIVVQSRGMERWISMELARLNGVSANCSFPFPNAILEEIFKSIKPDLPDTSPFDPDLMTFRLMQIISQNIALKELEDLKAYLADDRHDLKLYQLACKLADLFDQYQVFRPRLLFKWEQSGEKKRKPDLWQARLWRELARGREGLHRARLRENLLSGIRDGHIETAGLPKRVALFGISHLPLFHLQAFAELSRLIEINIFLISPCREYWGDIISDREIKKIRRKTPRVAENIEWYHFDKGNRLLASMGAQGRDFFTLISGLDCDIIEQFEEPQPDTVLSRLQADILNLRDREGGSEKLPLSDLDNTIQVHSCHSPMREIEVLHDNLLAMFEDDPQLLPEDIIVMAPDIEIYAPYVQAVFDSQTDRSLRIPYSIADQSPRTQSRVVEGFLALLDINEGRFGASDVLSLLEFPGIKERFDLKEPDQNIIEHWVRETRIRWGIDADSRLNAGYTGSSDNTWKAGLERLLLGYAMPGENRHLVDGVLPYDNIEGSDAQILGNFLNFVDRLFAWSTELAQPKSLGEWQKALTGLIDRFFRPDEKQERELYFLRNVLDNLIHIEMNTDLHDAVSLNVIKSFLRSKLEQHRYGAGFLTGGVTFCAMLPMRSIPFKIICLIGMNHDAYPRDFQPLNFDLIARYPRAGDRSRRNDDKYLFLESIISARNKLYISYVGQSIQDNSTLPPSVLVNELIEAVANTFDQPDKPLLENIVTRHRLQPFSQEYFLSGTGLFSYSMENMLARVNREEDPPIFVADPMPLSSEEEKEWENLDLDSLCRFFANPAQYFIRKRMGMVLEEKSSLMEDRENFTLAALEKYQVEQNLLEARMSGLDFEDYQPVLKATGLLPHGRVGEFNFNELGIEVENFVAKIEPFARIDAMQPLDVDLNIRNFHLSGRLSEFSKHGLVCVRYARRRTRDILAAWIRHLVLCCQAQPEYPQTSFLICKNAAMTFSRVSQCRTFLEDLLYLYRKGLEAPIHFFPDASYAYAWQKLKESASDRAALLKASKTWQGEEGSRKYYTPESDDPYYDQCFRRMDVLDEEFARIAMTVFEPILAYSKEITLR